MIQCNEAQQCCDDSDVLLTLFNILDEEWPQEPDVVTDVHEYAAMAMHNCLISTRSRWRAREFWQLPLVLVRNAHAKTNQRLQMHALKCLRLITEMPSVKDFVRKVCKRNIKRICCGDSEEVHNHKIALLQWLRYRNYRHQPPRPAPATKPVRCTSSELFKLNNFHNFPYRIDPPAKDEDVSTVCEDSVQTIDDIAESDH